jgi:8-oxo-dGTP diphosphatase
MQLEQIKYPAQGSVPLTEPFFHMAFSVDCVIFGFDGNELKILLIKRGEEPFGGYWALPGNLIYLNENIHDGAARVLKELTGLQNVYLEQVETFGTVDRHPLGRVITTAYYSLVKIADCTVFAQSHAEEVSWFPISKVSDLAFDHLEILKACMQKLKKIVRGRPVGFELLPPKFTLSELQRLYEAILEYPMDKRNFRKKILSMNILVELEQYQEGVAHRPARLYKFDEEKYTRFVEEGFSFAV